MCTELNVPYLGNLPVDPRLARCCDEGVDFLTDMPDSPAVKNLQEIVAREYNESKKWYRFVMCVIFRNYTKV